MPLSRIKVKNEIKENICKIQANFVAHSWVLSTTSKTNFLISFCHIHLLFCFSSSFINVSDFTTSLLYFEPDFILGGGLRWAFALLWLIFGSLGTALDLRIYSWILLSIHPHTSVEVQLHPPAWILSEIAFFATHYFNFHSTDKRLKIIFQKKKWKFIFQKRFWLSREFSAVAQSEISVVEQKPSQCHGDGEGGKVVSEVWLSIIKFLWNIFCECSAA